MPFYFLRNIYFRSEFKPQKFELLHSLTGIFKIKMFAKLGLKTAQFIDHAIEHSFLAQDGDRHVLAAKGAAADVEFMAKSRFCPYFLWPQDFHPV